MNNAHYDEATSGDWTYTDGATNQTFIFRKGTMSDPIVNPLSSRIHPDHELRTTRKDWIVHTSEWGQCNPLLIEKMCDLLNRDGFR